MTNLNAPHTDTHTRGLTVLRPDFKGLNIEKKFLDFTLSHFYNLDCVTRCKQ